MQPLYLKHQTRQLDQLAAHTLGISGFELMQKAGAQAAATLMDLAQANPEAPAGRVLVLTGNGNNAGDGYVLALEYFLAGQPVAVWPWSGPESLSPDALAARQDYEKAGGTLLPQAAAGQAAAESWQADWLADALLGTGINRPVTGDYARAIDWMNAQSASVFSLDIPSGLDADTGQPQGRAVKATATITFIALKPGLFTAGGPDYCGELFYADLDVPTETLQTVEPAAWLLEAQGMETDPLTRARDCHKGHFGHVLVVGGNTGMRGAAVLAAGAALRSGAGKVTVASPAPGRDAIITHRPEIMTADPKELPRISGTGTVLAIGPGLGRNTLATRLFDQALELARKNAHPCVLDADALTLLAEASSASGKNTGKKTDKKTDTAARLPANTVLTPHPKEAATLLGSDTPGVQANRLRAANELATRFQCVTVLKGNGTVIAAPDQPALICPFGTPGMATAGMGDVLTGVIAALMGQGLAPAEAARTGVLMHALAAEMAAKSNGLIASDVIEKLPDLLP